MIDKERKEIIIDFENKELQKTGRTFRTTERKSKSNNRSRKEEP